MDHIDLFVVMQEVNSIDKGDINSAQMHLEVLETFKVQKLRGQIRLNGKLTEEEIETYCMLDNDANKILESAISKFGLSHKSIAFVKKIGRTMADLSAHDKIEKSDVLEALSYRRR